ncbi:hypothetical protein [Dyella choica]|uniref:Uncharacterized protein n=1 Tax=Dyella choica TaxID=1927959 RepID=A0A432LZA8_9GAMM|nr:hypothetical protein [Dyella choica]RUL68722.1 hypothetical protein EKH80_23275 [Dyella choica]
MFANVVTLYRASGRPSLAGDRFSFLGPTNPQLDAAVSACEEVDPGFGRFADGPDYDGAGELDFTWSLSSNELGRFFSSVPDFIARCESIHRGEFPKNYYIAELDYFDGDSGEASIPELEKAGRFCELIRLLADLSLSGNLTAVAGRAAHMVFVKPASTGKPPVTVEIATRIEPRMLLVSAPDLDVLRDLLSPQSKGKVRTEEYKAAFRLAIADACAAETTEARFGALLDQWESVIQRFRYDVECIVDRMSFDVLRREIADAELTFVGRVNTSVVDNAAKFLGIPVSLVAVTTVFSGDSLSGDVLVCLGAVIVALVISGIAKATRFQLATTATAFGALLISMRDRAKAGGEVAGSIDELDRTFHRRCAFAKCVVATFQFMAWIPPWAALGIMAWKFPTPWVSNFLGTLLGFRP